MTTDDRFDALLVCEDSGKRGQLKQAALALPSFRKVATCPNLDEALNKLHFEECDVLFLSFSWGWEQILSFLKKAKQTRHGEHCAYILVLKLSDENTETVSRSAFYGIHGCLYEPYSAENLRVMAELAAKVKQEASAKLERAAVQLLFQEITAHMRALACLRKYHKNTSVARKRLEAASRSLQEMGDHAQEVYRELCLEFFEQSKPANAKYQGVSERIRKLEERNMLRKFEEDYKP